MHPGQPDLEGAQHSVGTDVDVGVIHSKHTMIQANGAYAAVCEHPLRFKDALASGSCGTTCTSPKTEGRPRCRSAPTVNATPRADDPTTWARPTGRAGAVADAESQDSYAAPDGVGFGRQSENGHCRYRSYLRAGRRRRTRPPRGRIVAAIVLQYQWSPSGRGLRIRPCTLPTGAPQAGECRGLRR